MSSADKINLKKLQSHVGNNASDAEDMIKLFLQIVPKQIKKLKKAVEQQNWENLHYISHQIKPTLDILGLKDALKNAEIIEEYAKTGTEVEVIKQFVNELSQELKEACNKLKLLLTENLNNKQETKPKQDT